jgi:hypothetical protein
VAIAKNTTCSLIERDGRPVRRRNTKLEDQAGCHPKSSLSDRPPLHRSNLTGSAGQPPTPVFVGNDIGLADEDHYVNVASHTLGTASIWTDEDKAQNIVSIASPGGEDG